MDVLLRVAAQPGTSGLLLRPWVAADAGALVEAYRDPVLRRWTRMPVGGAAEAARWLQAQWRGWRDGTRFSFAVVEEAPDGRPGRLVGNVAVKRRDRAGGSAEVGYWTAGYARGRGIAPRALLAVTGWVFDTLGSDGVTRLELRHQVDNPASCRVAWKTGYRYQETLPARPPFPRDGHLHVREAGPRRNELAVNADGG